MKAESLWGSVQYINYNYYFMLIKLEMQNNTIREQIKIQFKDALKCYQCDIKINLNLFKIH